MPRNGAMPSFELVQQPLRFLLRQPASNHRLWYLLGGFAIKLMAFGESAFVHRCYIRRSPLRIFLPFRAGMGRSSIRGIAGAFASLRQTARLVPTLEI